jgi:hypothetical protein
MLYFNSTARRFSDSDGGERINNLPSGAKMKVSVSWDEGLVVCHSPNNCSAIGFWVCAGGDGFGIGAGVGSASTVVLTVINNAINTLVEVIILLAIGNLPQYGKILGICLRATIFTGS